MFRNRLCIAIVRQNYQLKDFMGNIYPLIYQETFNKKPGDWFGPSATAHILQKALEKNRDHDVLCDLRAYVARDGTVYKG